MWLASVRLEKDLVPVGYSGSRHLAEAMASAIAMQVQGSRLRHDWLAAAH